MIFEIELFVLEFLLLQKCTYHSFAILYYFIGLLLHLNSLSIIVCLEKSERMWKRACIACKDSATDFQMWYIHCVAESDWDNN